MSKLYEKPEEVQLQEQQLVVVVRILNNFN